MAKKRQSLTASRRSNRRGPSLHAQPSRIEQLEGRVHLTAAIAPIDQALTTDPNVQQNPSIAADPLNPEHLVVSYMDRSLVTTGYAGIGVAVSENGGTTWTTSSIPLPASFTQGAATPVTQFDKQGHVFVSFSAATFLGSQPGLTDPDFFDANESDSERSYGLTSNNGIFVVRSDDGGNTWGTPVAVVSHLYDGTNPVLFDLTPDLAIDTFAKLPNGHTNPNFGNLYEVFTRIYTPGTMPGDPTFLGGTDGMIAVSRDHGLTWQIQMNSAGITAIDDPVRDLSDAPPGVGYIDQVHASVGPAGDVYVAEYGGGDFAVLHSTDAGHTFAVPDHSTSDRLAFGTGFTASPFNGELNTNQFRTNAVRDVVADPTRPGTVYAVEDISATDASGNVIDEADVNFAKSTDYGVTWSNAVKIGSTPAEVLNDDNGGQIASSDSADQITAGQAFARMSINAAGDIAVIWYDTRVDPNNHLLNVFGTVSTDGGNTFSPNFRLTDTSSDADAGAFTDAIGRQDYYLGDFIGLTIANNTAYAAWTDTRNGNQDIFATQFPITPAIPALNDRFEPNNTIATATALGQIFRSTLTHLQISSGDTDWYSFTAQATGKLTLSSTQATATGQLVRLELFDSTGTTLLASGTEVNNQSGQVTGEQLITQGTAGTGYLLKVTPIKKGSTYSLQFQSLTRDLGTEVYGQDAGTLAVNDQNYFLLKAPVSGSLQVQLDPGSNATGSANLEILDADTLDSLATGSASGNGQSATASVTAGQSLLLHVSSDSSTSGDYSFTFTDLDQETAAAASTTVSTGLDPSQTVVADVNGDGKSDLIVSNAASDTVSIVLGNGNGTFQAPRQYSVGPFGSTNGLTFGLLPNYRRAIAVADYNGDGIPDIAVTNYASGDVSVLLGNGDGTFQPQRRFNAVPDAFDLASADLTGNGVQDLVTISANTTPGLNRLEESVGVILGRGDGTFLPPKIFDIKLPTGDQSPLSSIRIADVNGDGIPDLIASGGSDSLVRIFLGKGNGTFSTGQSFSSAQLGPGLLIADVDGDGKADIINASFGTGTADLFSGNGDGTFTASSVQSDVTVGQGPVALAMADLGSSLDDGTSNLGPTDGHPDLIVANTGAKLGLTNLGPPDVVVLPSTYDSNGNFTGFGTPHVIYTGIAPQDVSVGDFNGDGVADVAVTDQDGIHIIFGATPTIVANDTPQTADDLGSVAHLAEPALSIVPGRSDAYFNLTAPTESNAQAGNEILDFSALFQHLIGTGLSMQVLDSSGNVLGTGSRLRLDVPQGERLTVHIFGNDSNSAGSFVLDVDTLPQVVSVTAESILPSAAGQSGANDTSIVIQFQGDRLDPSAAQDASNYQVIWLGADGVAGTRDDETIPFSTGQSVIYDPGANLDVASGKTYPTATDQTVTLLFDNPLPAGSYEIKLSSSIASAEVDTNESSLLAASSTIAGHSLVSVVDGKIIDGVHLEVHDLVGTTGSGNVDDFSAGTPFLTQLHSDLNAILDSQLASTGDNSSITPALIAQLLARFQPAINAMGSNVPPLLVLFLDPVSLNLADPSGNHISYNLQTNTLTNQMANAFVSVTGNVEVLVMPIVAGSYDLNVSDAPQTGRGGVAILGAQTEQTIALTDDIRAGQENFTFGLTTGSASASQFLAAEEQHADLVDNSSPSTDSQSTQPQEATPSNTATVSSSGDKTIEPPISDDAVAISDESLTVDASGQDQTAQQKKKHGQQTLPGRKPTTKPAHKSRPTTRMAADDKVSQKSVAAAAVPSNPHSVASVEVLPVSSVQSAAHLSPHQSPRIQRRLLGVIAVVVLSAQGMLGAIAAKKTKGTKTKGSV